MSVASVGRIAAPLRVEVADAIRKSIVTSEFKPGQRLVESVLCEKFDVSRTVIRESLRQLETEGLVAMLPNRGPVVATLTVHDAENLYEVRRSLESLAGSLFAERASDQQCSALLDGLKGIEKAMSESDGAARLSAKDHYYSVLLEGANNEEIGRMLRLVNARTQMLRMYSLAAEDRVVKTIAEIRRITVAAAVERDAEEARKACNEHVLSATEAAIGELKKRMSASSSN